MDTRKISDFQDAYKQAYHAFIKVRNRVQAEKRAAEACGTARLTRDGRGGWRGRGGRREQGVTGTGRGQKRKRHSGGGIGNRKRAKKG